MRTNWIRSATFLVSIALLAAVSAAAQTDIGLNFYGAFNGSTDGNGTTQSPSNSAGGLVELRHISNPLIGYEATYAYNRSNQHYAAGYACPAAVGTCPPPDPLSVPANAHEVTADWIVSVHVANLRPFALAGIGLLLNVPDGGSSNTSTSTKPVYVYGAGLDWGVLPHLGLRFQYRGNLYKAPDLTSLYTSTDRFTQTAEPMIGAYFRF